MAQNVEAMSKLVFRLLGSHLIRAWRVHSSSSTHLRSNKLIRHKSFKHRSDSSILYFDSHITYTFHYQQCPRKIKYKCLAYLQFILPYPLNLVWASTFQQIVLHLEFIETFLTLSFPFQSLLKPLICHILSILFLLAF